MKKLLFVLLMPFVFISNSWAQRQVVFKPEASAYFGRGYYLNLLNEGAS